MDEFVNPVESQGKHIKILFTDQAIEFGLKVVEGKIGSLFREKDIVKEKVSCLFSPVERIY